MQATKPQLSDYQILAMNIILKETLLNADTAVDILDNPRPYLTKIGLSGADLEMAIAYGDYLWDELIKLNVKGIWFNELSVQLGETAPQLSNRQVIAMGIIWQQTLLEADSGVQVLLNMSKGLKELGLSEADIQDIIAYAYYVFIKVEQKTLEAWEEDYEEKE